MIRDVNKEKRLEWESKNKEISFEDVIFTDETTVQIETPRTCCYKGGQKPRYKPKPNISSKFMLGLASAIRGTPNCVRLKGR